MGLRGETHGGEDVALFARGAGSDVVRGVINQNEVFHIMRRAFGVLIMPASPRMRALTGPLVCAYCVYREYG